MAHSVYRQGGIVFATLTANTTLTSDWFDCSGSHSVGFHVYSSNAGTRAGTITVQGTADPSRSSTTAVTVPFRNYTTGLIVTSLTVTASTEFKVLIGLPLYEFQHARLLFTDGTGGAGTGTLDAWWSAKSFGNSR